VVLFIEYSGGEPLKEGDPFIDLSSHNNSAGDLWTSIVRLPFSPKKFRAVVFWQVYLGFKFSENGPTKFIVSV